jgi:transcription initiation factor TFIIIB Brf1 subunit/transcription initiation factor TFIIB
MGQCPQCDGRMIVLDFDERQGWRYLCVECGEASLESEIDRYMAAIDRADAARLSVLARSTEQAGAAQAEGAD